MLDCDKKSKQLESEVNSLREEMERYPGRIETTVNSLRNAVNGSVEQIKLLEATGCAAFQSTATTKKAKWDSLKNESVTVVKDVANPSANRPVNGSVCIFIKDSEVRNTLQCWAIKIVSLKGWISLGISHNTNLCRPRWKDLTKHGTYVINSDGNAISNHNEEVSLSKKAFEFQEGNIIDIDYDRLKGRGHGTISFKKRFKEPEECFEMEVKLVPGKTFRPCVFLWLPEDIVKLESRTV